VDTSNYGALMRREKVDLVCRLKHRRMCPAAAAYLVEYPLAGSRSIVRLFAVVSADEKSEVV
jgi:hypothetical protein